MKNCCICHTTVQLYRGVLRILSKGGGCLNFFSSLGGLTPIGLETPQGTMHFTDLGVGGGCFRWILSNVWSNLPLSHTLYYRGWHLSSNIIKIAIYSLRSRFYQSILNRYLLVVESIIKSNIFQRFNLLQIHMYTVDPKIKRARKAKIFLVIVQQPLTFYCSISKLLDQRWLL